MKMTDNGAPLSLLRLNVPILLAPFQPYGDV